MDTEQCRVRYVPSMRSCVSKDAVSRALYLYALRVKASWIYFVPGYFR